MIFFFIQTATLSTFLIHQPMTSFVQHNPTCSLNCVAMKTDYREIKGSSGNAEGWQRWEMRWRTLLSLKFYSHLAPSTPSKFCAHGSLHRHRNLPFNHNWNLISCSWQRVLTACRDRLHQPFPRPTSFYRLRLPEAAAPNFYPSSPHEHIFFFLSSFGKAIFVHTNVETTSNFVRLFFIWCWNRLFYTGLTVLVFQAIHPNVQ